MFIRTFNNEIISFNINDFSYKMLWYEKYKIRFITDDSEKIEQFLKNEIIII